MGIRESQSHSATMATTFGKSCRTHPLLKDSEVVGTDKRWSISEAMLRVSAEVSGSSGGGPYETVNSSSLQISISSSASLSLQQSEMSHSQICSHHFPALNRRKCQSAHRVVAASCSSLRGCKLSRWWLGCVIMSGSRRHLVERWSYIVHYFNKIICFIF